jgi:hypothetical protein
MTKRESRETLTVTFDCPYARCDWPLCRREDSHPLCASEEERARRSVKIKAMASILRMRRSLIAGTLRQAFTEEISITKRIVKQIAKEWRAMADALCDNDGEPDDTCGRNEARAEIYRVCATTLEKLHQSVR